MRSHPNSVVSFVLLLVLLLFASCGGGSTGVVGPMANRDAAPITLRDAADNTPISTPPPDVDAKSTVGLVLPQVSPDSAAPEAFWEDVPLVSSWDRLLRFYARPADLTTAAESETISLVANGAVSVETSVLMMVASKVELVTWPENTPVAWTAKLYSPVTGYEQDRFAKVIVQPVVPLQPRWYALKVAPLDQPDRYAVQPSWTNLDAGASEESIARFRYGSEPHVIRIVETYAPSVDANNPFALAMELSEILPFDEAAGAITIAGPGTENCVPIAKYSEIASTVVFRCRSSVIGTVVVTAGPPFVGVVGGGVADGDASTDGVDAGGGVTIRVDGSLVQSPYTTTDVSRKEYFVPVW